MRPASKYLIWFLGNLVLFLGLLSNGEIGWVWFMLFWSNIVLLMFLGVEVLKNFTPHLISDYLCAPIGPGAFFDRCEPLTNDGVGIPAVRFIALGGFQAFGVHSSGGKDIGILIAAEDLLIKPFKDAKNIFLNAYVHEYDPPRRAVWAITSRLKADSQDERRKLPPQWIDLLTRNSKVFRANTPIFVALRPRLPYLSHDAAKGSKIALAKLGPMPVEKLIPEGGVFMDLRQQIDGKLDKALVAMQNEISTQTNSDRKRIDHLERELNRQVNLNDKIRGRQPLFEVIDERMGPAESAESGRGG